jgi:tetratricopeptide (TPR) repeat protein
MSGKSNKKAAAMPSGLPALPAGEMPGVADSRTLKSESFAAGLHDRWLALGVCIFLAVIIWVVFGQTLGHEFVNFDDDKYVYENPEVAQGLTLSGIIWSFTNVHSFNWHPLTWISHMLDCQLYGMNAGGHHLTNVLLHTASAILLFLVLRRMMGLRPEKGIGATTPQAGVLWRSAFVAAVFAIHPLRVESVAWVAERKDVLSGLFFMLTLWAYVHYAQGATSDAWPAFAVLRRGRPVTRKPAAVPATTPSPVTRHPSLFYGLVLLFFALGLMCKPMLVTLPLVLLLLDYWPLGRLSRLHSVPAWQAGVKCQVSGADSPVPPHVSRFTFHVSRLVPEMSHLLLEKLPLLGLAVASCAVTIFAQKALIQSFEKLSLPLRMGNASISCVAYLGQMFWPSRLAIFYPFAAGGVGVLEVVLSVVLLAGISTGVFLLRRRCPCFLTGWLWYLIMLMPVIGIVQVGIQARADRYTYLPQIGLYLMLTWAAVDLCAGWRHRRVVLGGGSVIILTALIICARTQTAYWRNSESLWTHTLACTSDNYTAHNILGNALLQKGKADEAIAHYQTALQIKPDYVEAYNNLGNALLQKGRVDEAIAHFQMALQIKPDYVVTSYNLGNALLQNGKVDEAMVQFQTALQIKPDYAEAHNNLGNALFKKGRVDEAIVQFQTALQIKPDSVDVLNNLAWLLATGPDTHLRDGVQAVQYAGRACELTHYGVPLLVGTLAAAYAEAGRFDDAISTAQKACALASASGEQDLLERNRKLLALYRAHQPYHEPARTVAPAAPRL